MATSRKGYKGHEILIVYRKGRYEVGGTLDGHLYLPTIDGGKTEESLEAAVREIKEITDNYVGKQGLAAYVLEKVIRGG